jgi:hypothetical protein
MEELMEVLIGSFPSGALDMQPLATSSKTKP